MTRLNWPGHRVKFNRAISEAYPNQYGEPDLRYVTAQGWENLNLRRCMKCHPSPIPPFADCPHGHVLTIDRLRMQLYWGRIRTGFGRTVIAVVFMYLLRYLWILAWLPILVMYGASMIQFAYHRAQEKNQIRFLARHPEAFNYLWEKKYWGVIFGRMSKYLGCQPVNEPWVKRML